MNKLQKMLMETKTENGDKAYKSTGDNLTDLFFMTPYFEKHLDEAQIGTSEKEKVFAMFIRDGRFGLGRRALGRRLMAQAGVSPENIVKAGRYDDLVYIPTDVNLKYLYRKIVQGDELAKKWTPRLQAGKKTRKLALALCDEWGFSKKNYRKFIKTDSTVEHKLSYAEKSDEGTPLNDLFGKGNYKHPLVDKIDFEKVPSLAMTKYTHLFSTRDDLKPRFSEYLQKVRENKAKLNVSTTNVHDAHKVVARATMDFMPQSLEDEARDVIGKKIVENATIGVELNAIVVLDTSGSMGGYYGWGRPNSINPNSLLGKAMSIAHGIATHSTYAKNQVISFSSRPQLMQIKGATLQEQYISMYTGDCSNTDFGKVMQLLRGLGKYPEYLIVISDMQFDYGSNQSKDETMRIFKSHGANTKIIWWNLNDRSKSTPEFDEYGNIFLSGYNMQILRLLENKFDMTTYIDKILEKYKKDIDYKG